MSAAPSLAAGEIARMLAADVDQLVADLLPAGHREGREWRCGSVAGEPGGSLGVHLTGAKAGIWADFSTDQAGDPLDLVRAVLRLGMGDALEWSRRWLGLEDAKVAVPQRQTPPAANRDAEGAARQARALDIWREATEDIGGTPAVSYVRSRGLDPARLYSLHGLGRWPATLRYSEHAALDPDRHCRALVVAVHGADCGLVRAIHRIMLHADGTAVCDDRGRKTKLSLGPIASNAAMGDYWPNSEGRWGLAEGIESALAAYALTGIPTWAAIAAGNMSRIAAPSWARHVTIFADHDPPGLAAAAAALERLRRTPGIESARIIGAKIEGNDAADLLGAHDA